MPGPALARGTQGEAVGPLCGVEYCCVHGTGPDGSLGGSLVCGPPQSPRRIGVLSRPRWEDWCPPSGAGRLAALRPGLALLGVGFPDSVLRTLGTAAAG